MGSGTGINDFIHEVFHQVQYLFEPGPSLVANSAFDILLTEQGLDGVGIHVYDGGDYTKTNLSSISSLSDISFYESRAQLVGDFAQLYSSARGGTELKGNKLDAVKNMSRILSNSGFRSEAINWVNENL